MKLRKPLVPIIAVAVMLDISEPHPVLGAERRYDALRKIALNGKPIELLEGGFNGSLPGVVFLGPHGATLEAAGMIKPERSAVRPGYRHQSRKRS